jgi:hypothetical protein
LVEFLLLKTYGRVDEGFTGDTFIRESPRVRGSSIDSADWQT